MPEPNQNRSDQQKSPSPKKDWQSPKLSILDIKANTLGGGTADTVEGIKTFPMS